MATGRFELPFFTCAAVKWARKFARERSKCGEPRPCSPRYERLGFARRDCDRVSGDLNVAVDFEDRRVVDARILVGRMEHAATLKHAFVERREDVGFDGGFDFVGVGLLDGANDGTGLIVVIHVRTFGLIAHHATEQVAFGADDVAETHIRDEADVAVTEEFGLGDMLAAELILIALVVDKKRQTFVGEVIHRVGTAHIPQPFLQFLGLLHTIPRDGVHNHKTVDFAVVLDVVLERKHLGEVIHVAEDVVGGVFPVGLCLIDVVVAPFLVRVEIGLDHTERAVVGAVAELEFAVLQEFCAEILGVRTDTVHQFEVVDVLLVEAVETFGQMTVLVNEAADLAKFARVNQNALTEFGNLVILERKFTSATNCTFGVGVAEVKDDVGVFVSFDGANLIVYRPFVGEERGEDFAIVAVANAAPNGEQVRWVPISCNWMCHSVILLLAEFNDRDRVACVVRVRKARGENAKGELFARVTMETFSRFDGDGEVAGGVRNRRNIHGVIEVGDLPIEDVGRRFERVRGDFVDDDGRRDRVARSECASADADCRALVLDCEVPCGHSGVVDARLRENNRLRERGKGVRRRSGGQIVGVDVCVREKCERRAIGSHNHIAKHDTNCTCTVRRPDCAGFEDVLTILKDEVCVTRVHKHRHAGIMVVL